MLSNHNQAIFTAGEIMEMIDKMYYSVNESLATIHKNDEFKDKVLDGVGIMHRTAIDTIKQYQLGMIGQMRIQHLDS